MTYRLWVDDKRTVLVRMWDDGTVEVSTRGHSGDIWNPPIPMREEHIPKPVASA